MTEVATPGQLRMSYLRWALILVPALLLLGSLAALVANARYNRRWLGALDLPAFTPADWVLALAWPLLGIVLGLALAMLIHARGAQGRRAALLLFTGQLSAGLAWPIIFFGQHRVSAALYLILTALLLGAAACWAAATVRRAAAWLMLPFLLWLGFMALLNFQIDRHNPNAETLVPHAAHTQI